MKFGEKLQLLRRSRGWSQEDLAQQISVSRQALSKWESGAAVPDTENVVALSRLFGVSTDYLLLEEQETASAPAAASAQKAESKWPVPRIVWMVILIVSAVGRIVLKIWASVNPSTTYYFDGTVRWTGVRSFVTTHNLEWLSLLLWVMLIAGFLGTVFYKRLRDFFCSGWLK